MSKESTAMHPLRTDRKAERGQILVLFTIAIVAIIAVLGLVLDGGSAFAQRRDQQNVADLAAVAGADAYLVSTGDKTAAAIAAAQTVAQLNGYETDPTVGRTVDVVVTPAAASASVTVTVTAPHPNNFSTILGMPSWPVSAQATAQSSQHPNGVLGAMPLMFNEAAFPNAICNEEVEPCAGKIEAYQLPGTGTEDVPQDATQFNWTVFCTHESGGGETESCEGDSDGVSDLIASNGTDTVVYVDDDIGPLNAGTHATLFGDLESHVGETFPVPIVDDDGDMVGWAYFKLTSVEGRSQKVIKGYFVAPYVGAELVVNNNHGIGTLNTGTYLLRLTD